MFLDDYFLRICLTLYYINLKKINPYKFFLSFLFFWVLAFPVFRFLAFFPGTDSSTILWMSTLVLGIKEINKNIGWYGGKNGGGL